MTKDWNAAYENNDTPWDKGFAAPPLEEFLERQSISGQVLVPGCGTGHDVRLLARQGANVIGLDISKNALRKASQFVAAGSERYVLGDVFNLDHNYHNAFDWVVEHTCLCAIEPSMRKAYAQSVREALKPKGNFLAIFFRQVREYDGKGPPHPIAADEIEALFSDDFEVISSFVPKKVYPSRPIGCEEVRWMRRSSKES